ncbi:hypothetical protein BST61_g3578 [Cercospora zeina]
MKTRQALHVAGTLVLLHFLPPAVSAQNCYYPNGDVARTDASCSSDAGACCPLGWECLSNGLCYLEDEDYYGRYTCTDRSWGGDCPQYCTSNNTAAGNEAIVLCSDGSWCCDKNRDPTKPDCCDWDDKEEIDVPNFSTVTSITSTPRAPSSVPSFTRDSTSAVEAATTNDASTSSSKGESSITSTSQGTTTITTRATSSDSTGGIVLVTSVIISQASSTPSSSSSSSNGDSTTSGSGDNNGTIIGASVGAALGSLSLLALAFFLYRRRKNRNKHRNPPTSDYYPDNHMTFMYDHGKNAHEIDSFPVADVNSDGGGGGGVAGGRDRSRPISELTGSNHFMPGAGEASPGSPVSSLGTSTMNAGNGTSPPLRSPSVSSNGATAAAGGGGGRGTSTVTNGPVLPGVQEQPEPQELPPGGTPSREMQQHPSTAVWMSAVPPRPPPKDQHQQPPSWSQPGYGQQQQQHAHVPWHPPQGFHLQQQQQQPGEQQQCGNPEMTEIRPSNSNSGSVTYQAYRPGHAAHGSLGVVATERNDDDDPFATAAPSSSGSGRSGASRASDEDALRTSSPDPPQPIQGGLRVVNQ